MTEISECEKTNVLRRAGYHQHSVTVFCQSSVEIDMCVCLCWSMCIRGMMRYNLTCRKPEWTCFSHREEMTQPGGAPPLCLLSLLQPVCVCVFLIQRGCGCVSLQGFGLRLHVSSENERHMSLIWSFDLLYLLLNICVCSVVSFFGGWNIEGFLAQVECLSVRECVCARVLCCAVLRVQSESKVSCKPVTVFAGVTLLPSSSSDCWVSALKQKVNSRSIHGKSVGGKISSWFAL